MSRSTVLVTEPEFLRAPAWFASVPSVKFVAAPSTEDALSAAIQQAAARHVVVGTLPYRQALYAALPRGGVLARLGVGYDGIDLAQATRAGLLCTNTPGVLDQSVAEGTMLFIASAARHLTMFAAEMQQERWAPRPGAELQGKTLAIIGSGRIGRAVARIASGGFQMRVIGCQRSASRSEEFASDRVFESVTNDFAVAVRDADYVSLHIPAVAANAQFINRQRLLLLREHAWLINTARGAVVDEIALYDALASGRLAGAALDVFEREPYEPMDPARDLRTLSNVILTPHVGSHTVEANHRMAERVLTNITLAEAGEFAAMDLLNRDVLKPFSPNS